MSPHGPYLFTLRDLSSLVQFSTSALEVLLALVQFVLVHLRTADDEHDPTDDQNSADDPKPDPDEESRYCDVDDGEGDPEKQNNDSSSPRMLR